MAKLVIHPVETVRTDSEMPFTFDGTLCTLRQPNGEMRVWETDLGTKPYRFVYQGPVTDPLDRFVSHFKMDYSGYSDRWPDGIWVQSFYQVRPEESAHPAAQKGDMLIGFTHREQFSDPFREDGSLQHDHGADNSYFIGLALSLDCGMSWTYMGDMLSNTENHKRPLANMGGVPFFVVDGQFQLFFNEYTPEGRYMGAARLEVQETIAALLEGHLPQAHKYSGEGKWEEPAYSGTSAPILPQPYCCCDAHSDAAYCAPLGKYLLTAWMTDPNPRLFLLASPDGVHWTDKVQLFHQAVEDRMTPYSTFVAVSEDDSSADCSTVGREFHIFFPLKGRIEYDYDEWKRLKITIED